MKMRFWLRPLLALAAAGVCLFLLGRLTRPKYTEGILEGGLIDDYYEDGTYDELWAKWIDTSDSEEE